MMKTHNIALILLSVILFSCSVAGRLEKRGYSAGVKHSTQKQRQAAAPPKEYKPDYMTVHHVDGTESYFVPTVRDENGEEMMSLQLQEVVVVAKSRTLPERLGKVDIDFVVTLPKQLQGNCRSVAVTPVLHKQAGDEPLQDLTIRGDLFSEVQKRNYWQYGKYLKVFRPDSLQSEKAFPRFIKYPYPEGVRLDSVMEHRETISYFYTQTVSTDNQSGNKLLVTLNGQVCGLDGSRYRLPPGDTLEYIVSSMLSFVDTTTRYVEKVIEKYAVVQDRSYIAFPVNRTDIIDTLGDNARQLEKITSLMDRLTGQDEFYVDTITLTASASPEGQFVRNQKLAAGRAASLRDYLVKQFDEGINDLITIRSIAEDWPELSRLIRRDEKVRNGPEIVTLIDRTADRDVLENLIRKRYPDDYRYIREQLYPLLRAVNFRYDLRRVGMIKDTIHTTEIDTAYCRGVELLKQRHYAAALSVLDAYNDRNTAIALLSLGYDQTACKILAKRPETGPDEYLKAIACARLGRPTEALGHFDKACEADERMTYRGRLDPEISILIKNR